METNITEMIMALTGGKNRGENLKTLWNLLSFEKSAIRHAIVNMNKKEK